MQSGIGSLVGTLIVGALRLPCLCASAQAVVVTGELATRVVVTALSALGFQYKDSWMAEAAKEIPVNIRPYKEVPLKNLAITLVACAALGIAGNAFVSWDKIGGRPPAIYNNVLSLVAWPFVISTTSYLDNLKQLGMALHVYKP